MTRNISDIPIDRSEDDILNRGSLVASISSLICEADLDKSVAIGICGRWGSGKTSAINLIRESLREKEDVHVLSYNPWLYESQTDLIHNFLVFLSLQFVSNKKRKLKDLVRKINGAMNVLEPLFEDKVLYRIIKRYAENLSKTDDGLGLDEFKTLVSKRLKESGQRIIVVIDDIDRLDRDEIRMVFKLVRSVADFSNIVYLLSYDSNIVEKALDCEAYCGKEYLQKIVNLPIILPEVGRTAISEVLMHRYRDMTGDDFTDTYTDDVLRNCVLPHMNTIREVNSLMSRFLVKRQVSGNNTHPADLLWITLVEMKSFELFVWIRKNKIILLNLRMPIQQEIEAFEMKEPSEFYKEAGMPDEFINDMKILFPFFGDFRRASRDTDISNHRISHIRWFDNYFILSVPPEAISDEMVRAVVYEKDPKGIARTIDQFYRFPGDISVLLSLSIEMAIKENAPIERRRLLSRIILMLEPVQKKDPDLIPSVVYGWCYRQFNRIIDASIPPEELSGYFGEFESDSNPQVLFRLFIMLSEEGNESYGGKIVEFRNAILECIYETTNVDYPERNEAFINSLYYLYAADPKRTQVYFDKMFLSERQLELYLKKLKKMRLGTDPYVELAKKNPHCSQILMPIVMNWYFLDDDLLPRPGVDRSFMI